MQVCIPLSILANLLVVPDTNHLKKIFSNLTQTCKVGHSFQDGLSTDNALISQKFWILQVEVKSAFRF